ncbi:MAG TPA: DUF3108 domain-containing protein [Flavobacteriales bacterium]|nr:DUF3108 domain-containing protein [Flavobacteriales bacterium]
MKTSYLKWGVVIGAVAILPAFNRQKQNVLESGAISYVAAPEQNGQFRTVKNEAFKIGEELRYRVHYGFVDAGEAVLKVKSCDKKVQGRNLIHVEGTGKSLGAFDWFFKVRDRYESYMDEQAIMPWLFVRRVNEGGYEIKQDYTFIQNKNKVDLGNGKTMDAPAAVQDMLSSFYYARTINFENAKVGYVFTVSTICDGELFPLKIKYMGKETISLRQGKYRCMRFVPVVATGRIFKNNEDLSVWITDDKNKIPILAKAKIWVGSIKAEVVEYKGLANPVAKVKK